MLTLVFAVSVFSAHAAPDRGEERIWTGKNGASFRGTYVESIKQGGQIRFFTSSGKVLTIAFGNLSEKDQKVIEGFEGKTPGKKSPTPSDPDAFKELPFADRNLIPERKAKDFGGQQSKSMTNSLWISLLWWNAFEVMPIPKSGDFERKAEWLLKELNRYVSQTGNDSTSLREAKEGITKYFSKRLEDIGACRANTYGGDLDPAKLSKLAKDNNIVILKMSLVYGNKKTYSECVVLEKIEADGTFSFLMYGKRHKGKMIPTANRKGQNRAGKDNKVYEFAISDRASLPSHVENVEGRFYINDNIWTGALVLEPFVYKTPGEPIPIPLITN